MGGRVCCLFCYLQSAAFSWCRASEEGQDVTFIHLLLIHTMQPRALPALSPLQPTGTSRAVLPAPGTAAPQLGPTCTKGNKGNTYIYIYT